MNKKIINIYISILTYINDTETCTYSVAMLDDFAVCSSPKADNRV